MSPKTAPELVFFAILPVGHLFDDPPPRCVAITARLPPARPTPTTCSSRSRAQRLYSKLFGTEPAKLRPGYANFAVAEPPLKLVLIEGDAGEETRLDHLGVEVGRTEQVTAATARLKDAGLATFEENDTSCCYAVQDKTWVTGPGEEPWEVYVVKADADTLGKRADGTPDACCGTAACCTHDEQSVDPAQTPAEAKESAGCACGS